MKSRYSFLFIFFLCISPVLPLLSIQTGDIYFYITDQVSMNLNKTANKTFQYYEELSLFSKYKNFSANFTIRLKNYYKQAPNTTLESPEFDLFRKSIHYRTKNREVTIGDFYSLLGRGMVLSVLKNEDILRERTIQGLKADLKNRTFGLSMMAGVVKDETDLQKWKMGGGEFRIKYGKWNRAGIHFSVIDDIDTFRKLGQRFTGSFSMQGSKLFKYLSYYAEAGILKFSDTDLKTGKALYSNITYNRGHLTVSAEYKYYRDFNNELNNPPIAEKEDEISTLTNSSGGRFLVTYTVFEPDLSIFFNYGRYSEYDSDGDHIYFGINGQDIFEKLTFTLSYGVRDILYPIKKFSADIMVDLTNRLSMEISTKDKRYQDGNFVFRESDHSVQFTIYPSIAIGFLYQYSHNAVIGLNHFYSVNLYLYLKKNLQLSFTGGSIRGGQVCSGGQCFIMPPFKGIKMSILKVFK